MFTIKLALALVAATGWQSLPAAPITPDWNARTSVWTGKQMLVFGRDQQTALDSRGKPYATGAVNVAASYDPATRTWRKLSPPPKTSGFLSLSSVWTGKEMLVWGQGTHLAYNPSTDSWRQLPVSRLLRVHDGFGAVVWTGKEMLGWGGGCCGDSFSDGVAYNPRTNSWHALPKAPLPGSQHPLGVWSGKGYFVVAGPRATMYDPVRNTWRQVAAPPAYSVNATAIWAGDRVVIAGATREVLSYLPAKNRWQDLPSLPIGRVGKVVAFDGARVLVWGGARGGASLIPGDKKWTAFAHGPLPSQLESTDVWTGTTLLVWGGAPTKTWGRYAETGASYTPPALGCGDAWMAENLRVTPAVKEQLRRASGATHPPLAGHTYYGRYSGVRYAIATFGIRPTIFRTDMHNRWHVRAQSDGTVCSTVVPVELLRAWSLQPTARGCFALPR
jgi:N-acetylneuraminic acid mutarotase